MTAARTLLALAGLSLGAYGALLLYDNPPVMLMRVAVWAAAGVLLHDFVFAPVCAAMGWARATVLPAACRCRSCGRVVRGGARSAGGPGVRQTGTASRQRDGARPRLSPRTALAVAAVALYFCGTCWRPGCYQLVRMTMVEQQRTRGVERQPPTV